jgi:hypothetical protein
MEKRMSTYSKEEIRSAILRAADSIDRDESLWNYGNCYIGSCGTPMCAAGWIGFHLGFAPDTSVNTVCEVMRGYGVGYPYDVFDDRMQAIDRHWHWEPARATATLRTYADKYFPAEKRAALDKAYLAFRASLCERVSE